MEALCVSWTYGEFTTPILFESLNLDQDGDGQFNDTDRAAIIEGETNWDSAYKGDVYLEFAGQDYPLGRPEAAAVTLNNNQVEVSFDLPLSQPIRIETAPVFLRLYDPFFYYAYTIVPPTDPTDLPEDCQAQIVPFEPNTSACHSPRRSPTMDLARTLLGVLRSWSNNASTSAWTTGSLLIASS